MASQTTSPSTWSIEQVNEWLTNTVQLSQYTSSFKSNDISGRELLQLTSNDLKDMSIESVGHRKKILLEIQSLRQSELSQLQNSQTSSQQQHQQQLKRTASQALESDSQPEAKRQKISSSEETTMTTSESVPQLKLKGKLETVTCMICFDDKEADQIFKPRNCWASEACENVNYCTDCLVTYCWDRIEKKIFPLICPNKRCGKEIIPDDLQYLLTPDQLAVYYKRSFDHAIATQSNGTTKFLHCPTPDCTFIVSYDELNDDNCHFRCELCREHYCLRCKVPYHYGKTCVGYKKWKLEGGGMDVADALFFQYVESKHIQRCPSCSRFVERRSGCSSMHCLCGADFCYGCGQSSNKCICHLLGANPRVPDWEPGNNDEDEGGDEE